MGTRHSLSLLVLVGATAAAPRTVSADTSPTLRTNAPRTPMLLAAKAKKAKAARKKPAAKEAEPSSSNPFAETAAPAADAPAGAAADPNEPALPTRLPGPIYCPTDDVDPGKDVVIRCALKPGLKPSDVTLHYRTSGKETFESAAMTKSPRGWYSATVPAASITGRTLQFYAEATKGLSDVIANTGDATSPNIVLVRKAGSGSAHGDEPDFKKADSTPLLEQQKAAEEAAAEAGRKWRKAKTWFVGFGLGMGYGWHGKRSLDVRSDKEVAAGFSSAQVLHLLPEVGYQWDERTAISLQTRHQSIPDEGPGDALAGPPKWSHAVLVHITRAFTEGNLQYFGSASVGGGSGFRLIVPPNSTDAAAANGPTKLLRTDTLRGGPIVLGPGGGVSFYVFKRLSAVAEARVLVGVPDFAAVGEINIGAQYGF